MSASVYAFVYVCKTDPLRVPRLCVKPGVCESRAIPAQGALQKACHRQRQACSESQDPRESRHGLHAASVQSQLTPCR